MESWSGAHVGAENETGPGRGLLELLVGCVLVLLTLHLAGGLVAAGLRQGPAGGLHQSFGSADASALGLAAPLLFGAAAAAAARVGWRVRAPPLLRAAATAAVLALADALSLPARLGPGLAAVLELRPVLGLAPEQIGGLLAGAAVAAAAGLLLAPMPVTDPATARVRRTLAWAVLALAALGAATAVVAGCLGVSAAWLVLIDVMEEGAEGLIAAWVAALTVSELAGRGQIRLSMRLLCRPDRSYAEPVPGDEAQFAAFRDFISQHETNQAAAPGRSFMTLL